LGFEESGDAIRKGYPTLIKDRKFLILPESPEEAKQYFK